MVIGFTVKVHASFNMWIQNGRDCTLANLYQSDGRRILLCKLWYKHNTKICEYMHGTSVKAAYKTCSPALLAIVAASLFLLW